jgi:hypothetical protein
MLGQTRFAQESARVQAKKTQASTVGKISGERNSDGTYEVEVAIAAGEDPITHSGVQSRRRAKWQDGQMVLLEWVHGQPQIAGFAPVGY